MRLLCCLEIHGPSEAFPLGKNSERLLLSFPGVDSPFPLHGRGITLELNSAASGLAESAQQAPSP